MKHVEVVCAIIKNDSNQVFCCQRGPGRALANKWEFPGGKVEQNETKEEALVREIKEELKSDIKVIRYVGVSNHIYSDLEKPFSITMYGFLCELVNGNLELTEHINSKWVEINELDNVDFAKADIPFLDLIKSL